MKEKPPLESAIVREICEWLSTQKTLMFWRSNNAPIFSFGGRSNRLEPRFRSLPKYTPRGLPDIVIIRAGRFIGVEVKRPGAKLRPEQGDFGMKLTLHGAGYIVVHSLAELRECLIL